MSHNATGKIHQINDVQQITEKFSKREFVLELSNNPAYVEKVLFTLIGDKAELINDFNAGEDVEIKFNLKGREWTSPQGDIKFFNTLEVWNISKTSSNKSENASESDKEIKDRVHLSANDSKEEDDLPF
jgi:hypothetical protein